MEENITQDLILRTWNKLLEFHADLDAQWAALSEERRAIENERVQLESLREEISDRLDREAVCLRTMAKEKQSLSEERRSILYLRSAEGRKSKNAAASSIHALLTSSTPPSRNRPSPLRSNGSINRRHSTDEPILADPRPAAEVLQLRQPTLPPMRPPPAPHHSRHLSDCTGLRPSSSHPILPRSSPSLQMTTPTPEFYETSSSQSPTPPTTPSTDPDSPTLWQKSSVVANHHHSRAATSTSTPTSTSRFTVSVVPVSKSAPSSSSSISTSSVSAALSRVATSTPLTVMSTISHVATPGSTSLLSGIHLPQQQTVDSGSSSQPLPTNVQQNSTAPKTGRFTVSANTANDLNVSSCTASTIIGPISPTAKSVHTSLSGMPSLQQQQQFFDTPSPYDSLPSYSAAPKTGRFTVSVVPFPTPCDSNSSSPCCSPKFSSQTQKSHDFASQFQSLPTLSQQQTRSPSNTESNLSLSPALDDASIKSTTNSSTSCTESTSSTVVMISPNTSLSSSPSTSSSSQSLDRTSQFELPNVDSSLLSSGSEDASINSTTNSSTSSTESTSSTVVMISPGTSLSTTSSSATSSPSQSLDPTSQYESPPTYTQQQNISAANIDSSLLSSGSEESINSKTNSSTSSTESTSSTAVMLSPGTSLSTTSSSAMSMPSCQSSDSRQSFDPAHTNNEAPTTELNTSSSPVSEDSINSTTNSGGTSSTGSTAVMILPSTTLTSIDSSQHSPDSVSPSESLSTYKQPESSTSSPLHSFESSSPTETSPTYTQPSPPALSTRMTPSLLPPAIPSSLHSFDSSSPTETSPNSYTQPSPPALSTPIAIPTPTPPKSMSSPLHSFDSVSPPETSPKSYTQPSPPALSTLATPSLPTPIPSPEHSFASPPKTSPPLSSTSYTPPTPSTLSTSPTPPSPTMSLSPCLATYSPPQQQSPNSAMPKSSLPQQEALFDSVSPPEKTPPSPTYTQPTPLSPTVPLLPCLITSSPPQQSLDSATLLPLPIPKSSLSPTTFIRPNDQSGSSTHSSHNPNINPNPNPDHPHPNEMTSSSIPSFQTQCSDPALLQSAPILVDSSLSDRPSSRICPIIPPPFSLRRSSIPLKPSTSLPSDLTKYFLLRNTFKSDSADPRRDFTATSHQCSRTSSCQNILPITIDDPLCLRPRYPTSRDPFSSLNDEQQKIDQRVLSEPTTPPGVPVFF